MQVVARSSPLVLEDEVAGRIAAAKAGDPLASVLVVVSSRRLADHLARRLVERFGVVLGVEIVHHAALARRILESAGRSASEPMDAALADTLARLVVRRAPPGRLRDFFRERPAALAALTRPLDDLREAGIGPAEASKVLTGEYAELAGLYARWTEALDAAAARGAIDHGAVAQAATPHAAAYAARFAAVIHHGAYELIGVHDALVRALDAGREVAMLVPSPRDLSSGPIPAAASFLDAQGAAAELITAARGALAAVSEGLPPHEAAVIVRSFGPYAAAMDALLETEEVPFHTSFVQPLHREPFVSAILRDFAGADSEAEATYAEHAAALETKVGATGGDTIAARALSVLARALGGVETILGETQPVTRAEAAQWLSARVGETSVPPAGASEAGIRVLDAMQARGLTFRYVALAGMNAGIFPRVGREDPFLPDAARARLIEATGRPLPLASRRDAEEHLILGMMLGAARDRIAISWRRADEAGRPVVPSLALRDIAHATGARISAADVAKAAAKLPAHPRARLAWWAEKQGLLRRDDEALLVALFSEVGTPVASAVVARLPHLVSGVALIGATDGFAPGAGAYHGRVGPGFAPRRLAATALDRLGACPLQFFFRHVLRVRVEPEAPTPFESSAAAVGERVHDVLGAVYRALAEEGAFLRLSLSDRVARAIELLRIAWPAHADDNARALAGRFPILDAIHAKHWLATLDGFVAADLARLDAESLVPAAFEHEVLRPLPGGPDAIVVTARYDRIAEGENRRVIGEYKTGGSLADRIAPADMLSGARLQVPLYALLEGTAVDLLGVGARHAPPPDAPDDSRFVRFDGLTGVQDAGMRETLGVLARLPVDGRFPLRPGRHCRYCEYASACRRSHPPTEHREALAPDVRDVRDCWEKSATVPTLSAVRAEVGTS